MRRILAILLAFTTTQAFGQGIVTQFNFNSNPSDANTTTGTLTPVIGIGTASFIGGTTSTFAGGATESGSTDTGSVGDNSGWNLAGFPTASAASGTAGNRFDISTVGASNLVFRFDQRYSGTASRFGRVEYTTNAGANWTVAGTFSNNLLSANTWFNNRTVDLSAVAAANGNSQFGVRYVSIFDPTNNTSYSPADPASTYGTGGTWRFDNVTLSSGHVWVGGNGTAFNTPANFQGGIGASSSSTVLLGTAGGANTNLVTDPADTTLEQLIFQSNAPAYTISGTGVLRLTAGIVNNATNAQTISSPVTFGNSNTIQNSGTLTLSGSVTFTNFLVLSGGVTNFNSTATGVAAATIRVAPTATIGGIGNLGMPVVLFANARIRGGNGTTAAGNPTLTTGPLTFNNTSRLQVVVGGPGATSVNTKILVGGTGAFNRATATDVMTIDLTNDGTLVMGDSYSITIANYTSTTATQANFNLNPTNFLFSGTPTITVNANNLVVAFVPVPEPSTVLGISALGLLAVRRVRKWSTKLSV